MADPEDDRPVPHTRRASWPSTSYERSVVYPNGHRNVIMPRRGIRPLPRGGLHGHPGEGHARHQAALRVPEALRRHLRLAHQRHQHGHRLARQRSRSSSRSSRSTRATATITRHFGAPRCRQPRTRRSAATSPTGFVWNALEKGYRLGFQSSSDHVSTHMSYAVVLTDDVVAPGHHRRLQEAALLRRHRQHHRRGALAAST